MISVKMKGNRYKQDNFHLPVETSIDGTQDRKSQPCCLSVRCKTEFMNATKTTLVAKRAALPSLPHVSTTLLAQLFFQGGRFGEVWVTFKLDLIFCMLYGC